MCDPHGKLLSKNNVIVPFEDEGRQNLEFLLTKNDCSMFLLASHNKKRPNNLILGRTFDRHILDMVELGITRFRSSSKDYAGVPKKRIGSKPMLLFVGHLWHEKNSQYGRIQNLFLDLYRGDPVNSLIVSGLDHIIVFTIADPPQSAGGGVDSSAPVIHQRTYHVKLIKQQQQQQKQSAADGDGADTKVPAQLLVPCGPDFDFKIRRTQYAAPDLWKAAMKQPKAAKLQLKKKAKNQSTNIFGETVGRLHLEKQDIDSMQGRRSKALRIAGKIAADKEKMAAEDDLANEKEEMGKEFKQTHGFDQDEMN